MASAGKDKRRGSDRAGAGFGDSTSGPLWRQAAVFLVAGVALVGTYAALTGRSDDRSSPGSALPDASLPSEARSQRARERREAESAVGKGWSSRSQTNLVEPRERVIGNLPRRQPATSDSALEEVERLLEVKERGGVMSRTRALEIRRTLRSFAGRGDVGEAAIDDFRRRLQNGELDAPVDRHAADESSTTVEDAASVNQASADPDGVGSLLERLAGTTDPMEVATLAQELDEVAPGLYQDEVVDAARRVLQNAAKDPPEERADVSPVFETLEEFGGDEAVNDLEKDTTWRQYSLMALAGMPDGKGIPSLLESASNPQIPLEQRPQLAFQMLGQAAAEYPEAGDALVNLARSGQIPEHAWRSLGSALQGMHLTFPLSLFDEGGGANGAPRVGGFENDTRDIQYDLRLVSSTWSIDQIDQQIDLIDRLMDATTSSQGRQALDEARKSLMNTRPSG